MMEMLDANAVACLAGAVLGSAFLVTILRWRKKVRKAQVDQSQDRLRNLGI